jgi:hypothetical protein
VPRHPDKPGSLAPYDSVEVLSRCPGAILGRDRDVQCDKCVCVRAFLLCSQRQHYSFNSA